MGGLTEAAGICDGRWPPVFSIFAMFGIVKDYHVGLRRPRGNSAALTIIVNRFASAAAA